ncbi:MAG: hypothetical protein C0402_05525 [Thermodesulfovibrio sp.]|nr:hypothetical protein [Thermodesulfovibrio sp.]
MGVRSFYVQKFSSEAFDQGLKQCEMHFQLVAAGALKEWQWPECPHPPGSDRSGSWTAGFYFGLPI